MTMQYPRIKVSNTILECCGYIHLEGHQQTFTLNIRKAQVDTAWVAFNIPISYYVFNFHVDFTDESIRELLDVSMVSLVMKLISTMYHKSRIVQISTPARPSLASWRNAERESSGSLHLTRRHMRKFHPKTRPSGQTYRHFFLCDTSRLT